VNMNFRASESDTNDRCNVLSYRKAIEWATCPLRCMMINDIPELDLKELRRQLWGPMTIMMNVVMNQCFV
jgi:hypothetical protein